MNHPDDRPDRQLIDAINNGDESAFETLYFRYRDWVVRLAHRFTGNGEDALDVLQETFSYVLRKFPGFRLTAAFTTFLYPVVRNLSIAARRKRGRYAGAEGSLDDVPAAPAAKGEDADLAAVLGLVTQPHREVLLMRFLDGMSLEEIAAALGVPLGTVKSRLHNAIQTLREDPRTRGLLE